MKNEAHFHRAEELNILFDSNPNAAFNKAIDYINEHQLNHARIDRELRLSSTQMSMILRKEVTLQQSEIARFVILVIEILAEFGIPIEPEY